MRKRIGATLFFAAAIVYWGSAPVASQSYVTSDTFCSLQCLNGGRAFCPNNCINIGVNCLCDCWAFSFPGGGDCQARCDFQAPMNDDCLVGIEP